MGGKSHFMVIDAQIGRSGRRIALPPAATGKFKKLSE